MSVAIVSNIERQSQPCATPQRPPSLLGPAVIGFCLRNTRRRCVQTPLSVGITSFMEMLDIEIVFSLEKVIIVHV